jgi:hypothetical protein
MATNKSLYVKFSGDYVPSTLVGEIWEIGVRQALVFGDVDDIGTFPDTYEPQAVSVARVESDWTITTNWNVDYLTNVFNPDDYLNDQCTNAITNLLASSVIHNQVRCRSIKCYLVASPTGKSAPNPGQTEGTPATLTYTSAYPTGGEGGTMLPPQDSVAVSLQTMLVGRHGKGRFFLPPSSSALLSGGKVGSTPQSDILDAGVQFMEDLAYTGTGGLSAHVRPVVTGVPFQTYGVVKAVRVGNIVDTQRRRRNRLTEVYSSAAPTY